MMKIIGIACLVVLATLAGCSNSDNSTELESTSAGLTSGWTGTCPVVIRDHYNYNLWDDHTKCAGDWGHHPHLVTIRNASNQPVFVNEWYAGFRHGQTTILPW